MPILRRILPVYIVIWFSALCSDGHAVTPERDAPAPAEPGQEQEAEKRPFPVRWGEQPEIQTMDYRPLPAGYGFGSSTLAAWIEKNLEADRNAISDSLVMDAAIFPIRSSNYYFDREQWLALDPDEHQEGEVSAPFPFPGGRYHVWLAAVGESDGRSVYEVFIEGDRIGRFECPLGNETTEEGPPFWKRWQEVDISAGDMIRVRSRIGSENGEDHSRGRWDWIAFEPADEATRKAAAEMEGNKERTGGRPALVQPRGADGTGAFVVSGRMVQWHKVVLTLDGPFAHERDLDPNPFTDYCMSVRFEHESGEPVYEVPGYFAADGRAAETSAEAGTHWRACLSPDKAGEWRYEVTFMKGADAALGKPGAVVLAPYSKKTGSFTITPADSDAPGFLGKGRLEYVGEHFLRFAGTGDYFLKAGPDAPETLLAYEDFDNTVATKGNAPLKSWTPHARDWRPGDPVWQGDKGKGLIGALNYLASKGVNSFSFLTYNAGGDGDNVWPFVERSDKLHYDVSKLDQWGIVFDHATASGLHLHFKMQETEMDDNRPRMVPESLDGGRLGRERKLYYRELIARFGHNLGLNWNIGEENTQSTAEIRQIAEFLRDTDPYHHNIVIHTYPNQQDQVYTPLLGDASELTGASLQNSWDQAHQRTLRWVRLSDEAGKPWVVANDEQGPADMGVPPDPGYKGHSGEAQQGGRGYTLDDIRRYCLWGTLMAGGAGVEYYFGYQLPESDLVCEDFRSRDRSWDYCRIALEFFSQHDVPFQKMQNMDALIGNPENKNSRYCLADEGRLYLVYLPEGGSADLDLSAAAGRFDVLWYNPRSGGDLLAGSVKRISAGGPVSLGTPPIDEDDDWLVVVRSAD